MNSIILIISYFVLINFIGFAIIGSDKHKARIGAFRIPEGTLFAIAVIGGSIGSIVGMYFFHHKTRKWYFKFGMPAILVLQLLLLIFIYASPIEFSFL